MKTLLLIRIAATVLLLFGVYWGLQNHSNPKVIKETYVRTDTVYLDSVQCSLVFPPEDIIDSLTMLQRLRNLPPDTIRLTDTVIKYLAYDYFSVKDYDTLLINDSIIEASLKLKISQNKLLKLEFPYKYTVNYFKAVETPENNINWYIGAGVYKGGDLSGEIFHTKDKMLYGASYHFKEKTVGFKVARKIW